MKSTEDSTNHIFHIIYSASFLQNQELVTEGEVSRVGGSESDQVPRLQDKVAELQAEVSGAASFRGCGLMRDCGAVVDAAAG